MKLQKEIHEAAKAYTEEVIANRDFDVNFEEDLSNPTRMCLKG